MHGNNMSENQKRSNDEVMKSFEAVTDMLLRAGWIDLVGEGDPLNLYGVQYTVKGFKRMSEFRDLLNELKPKMKLADLGPLLVFANEVGRSIPGPPEVPPS